MEWEPSRSVAHALRGWIGSVVQASDPWMSEKDVDGGVRWNDQLARVLEEAHFGIICVSKSNQNAPWLLFESGALAKSLAQGRVVPLFIDLLPTDITGPLTAFQGRWLTEDGIEALVGDVNAAPEKPVPPERLHELFDAMWHRLKWDLDTAISKSRAVSRSGLDGEPQRSAEAMLAEVVSTVRLIERRLAGSNTSGPDTLLADAPIDLSKPKRTWAERWAGPPPPANPGQNAVRT
jgi:hypothetical protein